MEVRKRVKENLASLQGKRTTEKAMVGFDGYVDMIQRAVRSAKVTNNFFFNSLSKLGHHIVAAAGKSSQVELRPFETKLGEMRPSWPTR